MKRSLKEKVAVQEQVQEKVQKEEQKCHHFWVIDVANGPSSLGKCKFCGEKKEFFNAFPTFNPLRKNNNPLQLPKLQGIEMDKESRS
jgi:hypothetical protein